MNVILAARAVGCYIAWLRSGNNENAYNAQYLSASGAYNNAFPARTLAVRPALHLKSGGDV
jgi:hypothetical protein